MFIFAFVKSEVTTGTTEIQNIVRDNNKQLYANKIDNLGGKKIPRKVQSPKTEPERNK